MRSVSHDHAGASNLPAGVNVCIILVRLWDHCSVVWSLRSTPIMANRSGSLRACTRWYSAGTTRRLVRSPPAPKITKVADCGWRPRGAFDAVSAPLNEGVVTVAIDRPD